MNSAECSLQLVHCEPVTHWPEGGTLVFLMVLLIGGVWLYRRWR
jgi:hypothetical protein